MNLPTPQRLLPLLLALLALGLSGCSGGCLDDCLGTTKTEDAAARVDYYKQAAKTYYDGGRYDAAVKMWEKVILEAPDDQWAKFGLAKSLHMMSTPQSLRRAECILLEIKDLCWVHPVRGDVSFEVKSTLANVYSSLANFYDRDVRTLEMRLERGQCDDTKALYQTIQDQKARRDELLRASIPIWNEVLTCSKDNPHALAGLAKANLIAGSEDVGIHYAKEYIRLSRDSQTGWRQQQSEWKKRMGSRVTTEQQLFYREKVMGAREKEIGMHLLLASVYMRREQFSDSVSEYDEVIALDPAVPAAYVERAQAYAAMGVYREAIKDLERYLKMTDPQKQRNARVHAAELLERYRTISEGSIRRATAAQRPTPAVRTPVAPAPQDYGSPDGNPAPRAPAPPPTGYGSPDG